jgi:hypothetical protein
MGKGKHAKLGKHPSRNTGSLCEYHRGGLGPQYVKTLYENRDLITRLMLSGRDPREIASQVGVPVGVCRAWCKKVQRQWVRENGRQWGEMLAEEVKRLKVYEQEAVDAWEESKKPVETIKRISRRPEAEPQAGSSPDDDGFDIFADTTPPELILVEESVQTTGQCGDPRFLSEARACVDMRLDIMGAYKPEVVKVYAGMITAEQMTQFANAVIEKVEQRVGDANVVRLIKADVLAEVNGGKEDAPTSADAEYVESSSPATSMMREV